MALVWGEACECNFLVESVWSIHWSGLIWVDKEVLPPVGMWRGSLVLVVQGFA